MKKLLVLILGIVTMSAFAACDRPITYNDLPADAQSFITQFFNGIEVLSCKIDDGRYEVYLSDGTELEFNRKGEWKSVDCNVRAVPAGIVPGTIATYVSSKFPNNIIIKIEKDSKGYDVELDNKIELKFDKKGNFLMVD